MPLAETVSKPAVSAPAGLDVVPAALSGWGGGPRAAVTLARPESAAILHRLLAGSDPWLAGPLSGGAIARGMGRSYGDAAQCAGGLVIDTTALRAFELDAERGTVTAQAGATLGELLARAAPAGWTLPTVPGTQHVTLGGAIASDVHGKNHGAVGSFGSHVRTIGLLTAAGEVLELTPEQDEDLLWATVGGLGLTGVILWAQVTLRPLTSPSLAVDIDRVSSLDESLAALQQPGGPHRVAWLDLLGRRPVRGVVTRAAHLSDWSLTDAASGVTVDARLTLRPRWPSSLLRTSVVRAHNELRFHLAPKHATGHIEPFGQHMFPLDVLNAWPRLYGEAGFVQYQLVLPRGEETALEQVLTRLRASTVPCYLAVLKDFGPGNDAPLSFPMQGWTLAMDLPRAAPGLEPLLRGFDELVAAHGGRVYLSKDSRLAPDLLAAMYPRLDEWRAIRDRADPDRLWRSDLSQRTGLLGDAR
ncbi:MAG: FAD-binding oxidoreductase [Actinomycetota bacterium]|nr:FAD-binding oxidoreductase [Actinomycetota bacterium]